MSSIKKLKEKFKTKKTTPEKRYKKRLICLNDHQPNFSTQFDNFLKVMNMTEEKRREYMQQELERCYGLWSDYFNLLKLEFNNLWDVFCKIEAESKGWFCVSPTLSPWKAVGHDRQTGYVFSACIMKNTDRNAPMAEKSLTVSYGHGVIGGGIGDEFELGRQGEVTDNLVGIENCNMPLEKQYQAAKKLAAGVDRHKIMFRLNHKTIGQEASRLNLSILDQHSLQSLAERLFVLLNKDMVEGLTQELPNVEKQLLEE